MTEHTTTLEPNTPTLETEALSFEELKRRLQRPTEYPVAFSALVIGRRLAEEGYSDMDGVTLLLTGFGSV